MTKKELMSTIGVVIALLVLVLGVTWIFQGSDFFLYKVFGLKYEDQRREIFEHSKAFNQGMIQELQNMQFEYVKADEKHKDALASIILHRVADYDVSKLPPDLKKFIDDLRRERTTEKSKS